jgi:hypothetical protein
MDQFLIISNFLDKVLGYFQEKASLQLGIDDVGIDGLMDAMVKIQTVYTNIINSKL